MKQRLKNQNGTTLVELIVCMVLLAIFTLAAVTLIQPSAQAYMDIQQQTRAQNLADALIETIRGEVLEGRRWTDFCALDQADRDNAVEMDTVVGRQGRDSQCILTLFVRRIGFQFHILLPDKSATSVVEALDTLQELCGPRFSQPSA